MKNGHIQFGPKTDHNVDLGVLLKYWAMGELLFIKCNNLISCKITLLILLFIINQVNNESASTEWQLHASKTVFSQSKLNFNVIARVKA